MSRGSGTVIASGTRLLYGTRQATAERSTREQQRLQRAIDADDWATVAQLLNALGPNISTNYSPETIALIEDLARRQAQREGIVDPDLIARFSTAIVVSARQNQLSEESFRLADPERLEQLDQLLSENNVEDALTVFNDERESLVAALHPAWCERRQRFVEQQLKNSMFDDPNAELTARLAAFEQALAQGPVSYLQIKTLDRRDVGDMQQGIVDGDYQTVANILNEVHLSLFDRDNGALFAAFAAGPEAALTKHDPATGREFRRRFDERWQAGQLREQDFLVFDEAQRRLFKRYLRQGQREKIVTRLNLATAASIDAINPVFQAFISDLARNAASGWPVAQRSEKARAVRQALETKISTGDLAAEDLAWLDRPHFEQLDQWLAEDQRHLIADTLNDAKRSLLPPLDHPEVQAFFQRVVAEGLPEEWGVPVLRRRFSSAEAETAERALLLERMPEELRAIYRQRDLDADDLYRPPFPAEAALQLAEVGPLTQQWIEDTTAKLYVFPDEEQLQTSNRMLHLADGPEPGRARLRDQLSHHLRVAEDIAGQRSLNLLGIVPGRYAPRYVVAEDDGLAHARFNDTDPSTICGRAIATDNSPTGWHQRLPAGWHSADAIYGYHDDRDRTLQAELPSLTGRHDCPDCQTRLQRWESLASNRLERPAFLSPQALDEIQQAASEAIAEQASRPDSSWLDAFEQAAVVRRRLYDAEVLQLLSSQDHAQVLQLLARGQERRREQRLLPSAAIFGPEPLRVPTSIWQAALDEAAAAEQSDDFGRPTSAFKDVVWRWLEQHVPADVSSPDDE
jgi:hypothetical protein